jgi:DNA mismatch repair ATPase MutS
VEQTESTKEKDKRNEGLGKKHPPQGEAVVKRELFGIYSKGTFVSTDPEVQSKTNFEANYVLAINKELANICVCYFDVSTMQCYMGQFVDDTCYSNLRTLISQIRPVEVIYERDSIPSEMIKLLKNQPTPPSFTVYSSEKIMSLAKT